MLRRAAVLLQGIFPVTIVAGDRPPRRPGVDASEAPAPTGSLHSPAFPSDSSWQGPLSDKVRFIGYGPLGISVVLTFIDVANRSRRT